MGKGVISFVFVFIVLAVIASFIFAFSIPFLIGVNTSMFNAGSASLDIAVVDDIQNAEVRNAINATITSAQESTQEQIETMSFFYRYSWVFIIIIIALVMYLLTRESVETDRRRGLGIQ